MKFSMKDFLSKCDQIHRKLRIWSYFLKKSLMESFIYCAVFIVASGKYGGSYRKSKYNYNCKNNYSRKFFSKNVSS